MTGPKVSLDSEMDLLPEGWSKVGHEAQTWGAVGFRMRGLGHMKVTIPPMGFMVALN